jgi:energy-coupling factor transporter ATP-binding protein EcfA2
MKIVQLTAENVKRIKAVSIRPDGSVVQITGSNGSGESSLLDSIFYALTGTSGHPSAPIRRGAESATVKLDLGEITVTRRFTAAGTTVTVEAADGARYPSPQKMLDALLGNLSMDPLAFTRMKPAEQLATLRGLVTLDVDVDRLDGLNRRDFEVRTEVNRRGKALVAKTEAARALIDPNIDCTLADESVLLNEMESASATNTALERETNRRARMGEVVETWRAEAAQARQEAARLLQRAEARETDAAKGEAEIAALAPLGARVDVTDVRRRLDEARTLNALRQQQLRAREEHAQFAAQLTAAREESTKLTAAIEQRTREKAAAIARATMPVPGLSFGDGQVVFNDLPFEQASSAEQIKVSFGMAMAANPRLKVVLIRDGSLLDTQSLETIAAMAEQHGFQVWIERVSTGSRVGIELSDGAIVGAETPAPVEEPAGV